MGIKINKFEFENVKRIKAIKYEPTPSGLTVIGGKNRQGKTSVLDSIAWALGGDRYSPSQPQREGSVIPPYLHVVLSNGLVVERKGKNSDLKVTDPSGKKGGQQLLNEFISQLALDLPKFMESTNKEKANILLQVIGVGDKLEELEKKETELYNQRHAIGQIADQKRKFAKEQTYYPDAPREPVSASDLIKQQQEILARNGENQRKREHLGQLLREDKDNDQMIEQFKAEILQLQNKLHGAEAVKKSLMADIQITQKTVEQLKDESTAELEQSIRDIEEINTKVRANLDKDKAEDDALNYENKYSAFTEEIDGVRKQKIDLLENAKLPLPGLSVENGELTYNGFKWDNMASSDQLKVSVAIVRTLNPKSSFVLLDKLEQLDLDTLKEFSEWLEKEDLQVIATRVSTGDECSIIIEDGYISGEEQPEEPKKWKAGEF